MLSQINKKNPKILIPPIAVFHIFSEIVIGDLQHQIMVFLGKGERREEGYSRIKKSWCVFKYKDNTYLNLMTWVSSPGREIWDTFVYSGQSFLPSPDTRW